MKKLSPYILFVLLLLSCSEEQYADTDQLKSMLLSLQKQRDSLAKTQRLQQDTVFEMELEKPTEMLATDSNYLLQQESLRQIKMQLKSLDKEIEDKQEQIYKPK